MLVPPAIRREEKEEYMSLDDDAFDNLGSATGIAPMAYPLLFMLAVARMNPFLAPLLR